jgi:periplasmic protein TonB
MPWRPHAPGHFFDGNFARRAGVSGGMFEQSMVAAGPVKRGPVVSSVLLQMAVVSGLLLVPLIWVEQLPAVMPLPPEVFAPRTLKPMKVFAEGVMRRVVAAPVMTERRLFVPVRVPERVAMVDDRPRMVEALVGDVGAGVGRVAVPGLEGVGVPVSLGDAPPPKPAVVATKPAAPASIRVTSALQASKLVYQVKPPYPELAKRARIQGVVRLQAVIAADGTVQRLQVVSGHPLLAGAAVEAVRQWRYSPTLLGGSPVEVVTQVEVNFVLAQ